MSSEEYLHVSSYGNDHLIESFPLLLQKWIAPIIFSILLFVLTTAKITLVKPFESKICEVQTEIDVEEEALAFYLSEKDFMFLWLWF